MRAISFFLAFVLLISCSNQKVEAINYNNELVSYQAELTNQIDYLQDSFASENPRKIMDAYNQTALLSQEMVGVADTISFFKEDSAFTYAFKQMVLGTDSVIDIEYKILVNLLQIPKEQYSIANEEEYNQTVSIMEKKLLRIQDNFLQAQKNFATAYGFVVQ